MACMECKKFSKNDFHHKGSFFFFFNMEILVKIQRNTKMFQEVHEEMELKTYWCKVNLKSMQWFLQYPFSKNISKILCASI